MSPRHPPGYVFRTKRQKRYLSIIDPTSGLRMAVVGRSWFEIYFTQGRAGLLDQGGGRWCYYLRDPRGCPIGREEFHTTSKEDALRRIKNITRKLGWVPR